MYYYGDLFYTLQARDCILCVYTTKLTCIYVKGQRSGKISLSVVKTLVYSCCSSPYSIRIDFNAGKLFIPFFSRERERERLNNITRRAVCICRGGSSLLFAVARRVWLFLLWPRRNSDLLSSSSSERPEIQRIYCTREEFAVWFARTTHTMNNS